MSTPLAGRAGQGHRAVYPIMEYVDGVNLRQAMRSGGQRPGKSWSFIGNAGSARLDLASEPEYTSRIAVLETLDGAGHENVTLRIRCVPRLGPGVPAITTSNGMVGGGTTNWVEALKPN